MPVILVVEDNEANLELVTRFLRREGHQVLCAANGQAGVSMAQEHVPDLILMDLGMPGMDGWEATQQIRSTPKCAHIPVIALTAHSLAEDVRKAIVVGFDAYETKPVVYRRLMDKIREFVDH
ncbi:MAG: response regulator [Bryobacteraceae bacterium]|jgi:CheY-like chemotaxis protein